MKVSKLVGSRFKEKPADCVIDSHALMVRGGYMKYVGNGIFSEFPTLRKITAKIENIIRSEMDAIDGQEVLFPVVLPADLWEESGRYDSVGSELLRFTDRNNAKHVLGMTHEEAAVHLVREYAQTYTKYPFMIYQIQTKFRDEARPRAGLIRVREFTMKDAYSFHTSQEDLERYYAIAYKAYNRIFQRAGIPEVVTVASDSGMMGGSLSHEYMLLTPVGEDSIVLCNECDFRANMEAAKTIVENQPGQAEDLECIETPDCKTIEDVCGFLKSDVETSCKAVVYQKNSDDTYVVAFVRGDYEINETKLRNLVGEEIHPADITEDCGLVAGYIGPYQITDKAEVYLDVSLKGIRSMVAGANKEGYHYKGLNLERELGEVTYHDISKIREGGICPCCGKPSITIKRGIDRAAGDANSVNYVANTYEGYGPNGTAIIVDTLTDNKNRTAANVRNAFTKGGGNVGTTGCVSYMFDNKGQIIIDKEECDMDADDLMMMALDAGAEDFSEEEDSFEIITTPDDFSAVREALEKEGIKMAEAELTMIPQNYVDLTDPEVVKKFTRILDLLDEDDDVQAVYHNANLPDEE